MRIEAERIDTLERNLRGKTVGLIGDCCVDIYWHADMRLSELSRETPHYPLPVTEERFSLGAGGNVAANMAALRPGRVLMLSAVGADWRASLLRQAAERAGVDTSLIIETPGRVTNAYCKPTRRGISELVYEDPRLDFENHTPLPDAAEEKLIAALPGFVRESDVIAVSDQFRFGVLTPRVRESLLGEVKKAGKPLIIDSRSRITAYPGAILKPNEVECWRAVYGENVPLPGGPEPIRAAAAVLSERLGSPVFCTLGANGSFYASKNASFSVPAVPLPPPLDICGAGDTTLAAFASALGAGEDPAFAAAFASLASAVTVQKLGQTGTASFDEIRALLPLCD